MCKQPSFPTANFVPGKNVVIIGTSFIGMNSATTVQFYFFLEYTKSSDLKVAFSVGHLLCTLSCQLTTEA